MGTSLAGLALQPHAHRNACDVCVLPGHRAPPTPSPQRPPGCVLAMVGSPGLWQLRHEPPLPGDPWGQCTVGGDGLWRPPAPQAGLSPRHPGSPSGRGDPLSGLCDLSPGKSEGNGKMHITLCDLVSTWDSLSPTQKKSLNQRYQMGCECKVSSRAVSCSPQAGGLHPEAGVGSVGRCSSLSFKDDAVQGHSTWPGIRDRQPSLQLSAAGKQGQPWDLHPGVPPALGSRPHCAPQGWDSLASLLQGWTTSSRRPVLPPPAAASPRGGG